jgi:F0F1-type ATP synthase assembly protein I
MAITVEPLAWRLWRKDVAASLLFQWGVLSVVCAVCAAVGWDVALNALLAGLAVLLPYTVLGIWLGVRLLLGKADTYGALIGGFIKTVLSVVLLTLAIIGLQELKWVWQGFFAGLIAVVIAPALFGVWQAFKKH